MGEGKKFMEAETEAAAMKFFDEFGDALSFGAWLPIKTWRKIIWALKNSGNDTLAEVLKNALTDQQMLGEEKKKGGEVMRHLTGTEHSDGEHCCEKCDWFGTEDEMDEDRKGRMRCPDCGEIILVPKDELKKDELKKLEEGET